MRDHAHARVTCGMSMPERRTPFVDLGSVIQDALKRLKPPDDAVMDVVRMHWSAAAGELVAQHAQPERMEQGVLYVNVENHLWLQELRRGVGRHIQENLAKVSGVKVRTIRWQLAPRAQ